MMTILSRLLGIGTVGEHAAGFATEKTSSPHARKSRMRRQKQQRYSAEFANTVAADDSTIGGASRSSSQQVEGGLAFELDVSAFCSELEKMRAGMTDASSTVFLGRIHVASSEAPAQSPLIATPNVLSALEGELEAAICFLRDGAARA